MVRDKDIRVWAEDANINVLKIGNRPFYPKKSSVQPKFHSIFTRIDLLMLGLATISLYPDICLNLRDVYRLHGAASKRSIISLKVKW